MKWIFRLFVAPVLLILIVLAGLSIFVSFMDLNDYKPMIADQFKAATGRTLTIEGDIRATIFPVLGATIERVSIGNPPGFERDTLLTAKLVKAGVKVLPLMNQRVEISHVFLDEPIIYVTKKKSGAMNTDFSTTHTQETAPPSVEPQAGDANNVGEKQLALQIDNIQIQNAQVTYDDLSTGMSVTFNALDLTVPGFASGKEIAFDLTTVANIKTKTFTVESKIDSNGTVQANGKTITLQSLNTDSKIALPGNPSPFIVQADVSGAVDATAQTLDLAIKSLSIEHKDTNIKGTAGLKGPFAKPAVTFDLTSSSINLDKMFAVKQTKDTTKVGETSELKPAATSGVIIPSSLIRILNMDGSIAIASLVTNALTLTDVTAKIRAKDGDLKIAPVTAKFYNGIITADMGVNAQGPVPVTAFKSKIKDVQGGPVIAAKMGDEYVSGVANANIDLKMTGDTMAALKNSAGGTIKFAFENGTINKWNLSTLINQAIAFIKTKQIAPLSDDQLHFASFTGTFVGANGVFQNDDVTLAGPKLHAFGNGTINLPANTVDYTVQVGDGAPDRTAKHVPIRMTGPLTAPKYNLDVQALVKDKVQEQVDKARDKFTDKLMKKLGGDDAAPAVDPVTGEPAPAPAPETPKDIGRELLKGLLR